MADTGSPGMKSKIPGPIRAVLIVSLTLNLLVGGVVVGGLIIGPPHPPRPMVGDIGMGTFTEALSREDREALRRAAAADGLTFREMRRQSRADMEAFIAALEADVWDGSQLQHLFDAYRTRSESRMAIGERLFAERIAAMSPEARKAYAARLQEMMKRPLSRRSGGDAEAPPPPAN